MMSHLRRTWSFCCACASESNSRLSWFPRSSLMAATSPLVAAGWCGAGACVAVGWQNGTPTRKFHQFRQKESAHAIVHHPPRTYVSSSRRSATLFNAGKSDRASDLTRQFPLHTAVPCAHSPLIVLTIDSCSDSSPLSSMCSTPSRSSPSNQSLPATSERRAAGHGDGSGGRRRPGQRVRGHLYVHAVAAAAAAAK